MIPLPNLRWIKSMFLGNSDQGDDNVLNAGITTPHHNNPFFLAYMGFKYDSSCTLCVLPPEVLGLVMIHVWVRRPLFWRLLKSKHCQLIVEDPQTVKCSCSGYRGQPFFSTGGYCEGTDEFIPPDKNNKRRMSFSALGCEAPLKRGQFFFRYVIADARTTTTMEIGVVDAEQFANVFTHQDVNCSNLTIRESSAAFLYSWNGGLGRLFGKIDSGHVYNGYQPQEQIIMELDLRSREPETRQLLFYRAPKDWENSCWPTTSPDLLARYWGLPEAVVPMAYLLGSGYDTKVRLIDVFAMY